MGIWFETRRVPMADGRVRVVVDGELDISTAEPLERELATLSDEGASVVLDLTGVTFMDSVGVRMLWNATSDAQDGNWSLEVAPPIGLARRVLDCTGIGARLSVD